MNDLKQFLTKAKKAGYASGKWDKEADGSNSTRHTDGQWSFHDNWFGGEPFGGREVVFRNNKPYWMMVYYGSDSGKAPGLIAFLQEALGMIPEDMPVRGPAELTEGEFKYKNNRTGNLEEFHGEEKIFCNGEEVYYAKYAGGLVDQRSDQ